MIIFFFYLNFWGKKYKDLKYSESKKKNPLSVTSDGVLQEEDEVCVCGKTDVQEPMHFDYTPRWRRESVAESRCLAVI